MKQFRYVVNNFAGSIQTLAENDYNPSVVVDDEKEAHYDWYKKQIAELKNSLVVMQDVQTYADAHKEDQMTISHIVSYRHNNGRGDKVIEIVTFR